MTFFNPLSNLNINFGGINNLFTPNFGMFQCFSPNFFNWTMPSFNNFNWGMPSIFNVMPFSNNYNQSYNIFSNPFGSSMNSGLNNFQSPSFNNVSFNFNLNSPSSNWSNYSSDTFVRSSNSSLRMSLADKAKSYVGRVNSDREGNRLFSGGRTQSWCADFVSYNIKQTYGSKLPSSFRHFSAVSELKQWGENNNCYRQMPSSGKANYIANNVKIGDIMIEKKGGKSHTGIVTKVNSDGSFETVEGNCGNKVAIQKYSANSSTLSGFISMDKYATA